MTTGIAFEGDVFMQGFLLPPMSTQRIGPVIYRPPC